MRTLPVWVGGKGHEVPPSYAGGSAMLRCGLVDPVVPFPQVKVMIHPQQGTVPRLRLARGPANRQPIRPGGATKAKKNARVVGGKVTPSALDATDQLPPLDLQRENSTDGVSIGFAHQLQPQPVMITGVHVPQESHRLVAMADDEIRSAV